MSHLIIIGAALLAFVTLRRLRYVRRARAWAVFLAAPEKTIATWVQELNCATAFYAWTSALRAKDDANHEEAVRLLGLTADVIESGTPLRVNKLRRMRPIIAMLSAMAPQGGLFRLYFRVCVVAAAFRYDSWQLQRARAAVAKNPRGDDWERFAHFLGQWRRLDQESSAYVVGLHWAAEELPK